MVMISLSASPACGPRFLAGWASWFSSRACQCGLKAWQKSSNWQKSSTSRSNIDASPPLMVPTQEEECRGDKGLASPQTRNSGYLGVRLAVNDVNLAAVRALLAAAILTAFGSVFFLVPFALERGATADDFAAASLVSFALPPWRRCGISWSGAALAVGQFIPRMSDCRCC